MLTFLSITGIYFLVALLNIAIGLKHKRKLEATTFTQRAIPAHSLIIISFLWFPLTLAFLIYVILRNKVGV